MTPSKLRIASHQPAGQHLERRRRWRSGSRAARRGAVLAGTLALLVSAGLSVAAAHGSSSRSCATVSHHGERDFRLKAQGVSCATARRLPLQWYVNVLRKSKACNCVVNHWVKVSGFTCKAPSSKLDRLIDCRKPGARVSWHQGAPLGSCVYTRSCNSSRVIDDRGLRV